MHLRLVASVIALSALGNSSIAQTNKTPSAPGNASAVTQSGAQPPNAQLGSDSSKPVAAPPPLPFTSQVKKVVVFIQVDCLHEPTSEELSKMTPEDRSTWSPENLAQWTPEKLAQLKPEQLAKWTRESHSGTGFIVYLPDERLGKNDRGDDEGFLYLVTNRHVVQPGIESGKPCKVLNYSLALNHKGKSADDPPYVVISPLGPSVPFVFPTDVAVDLAILPISLSQSEWDFQAVSTKTFATPEMIAQHQIVEGDPVLFSGLFIQYSGSTKLEPVIRTGALAMLPSDLMTTTLGKPGHIYLAEAHVFGGNSGSPMFVDAAKFRNGIGFEYKFLGVVSGEILETSDLTLQVTTSYKTSIAANSNVSMIVPADDVEKMLHSTELSQARDRAVAAAVVPK
jgi:hypothetical protein